MKSVRTIIPVLALLLVCSVFATAQTPDAGAMHFNKDGLAFDYPAGWTLEDTSNGDVQQMVLSRADSDAQIKFYIHRNSIKPENLDKARHLLVDPYVEQTTKTFESMGTHPERSAFTTEIGGVAAEGVKLSAVLDGDPGAAEIASALVNQRLVILSFFGPDREMKKANAAWELVRTSMTIEGALPQPKASPKATP